MFSMFGFFLLFVVIVGHPGEWLHFFLLEGVLALEPFVLFIGAFLFFLAHLC